MVVPFINATEAGNRAGILAEMYHPYPSTLDLVGLLLWDIL